MSQKPSISLGKPHVWELDEAKWGHARGVCTSPEREAFKSTMVDTNDDDRLAKIEERLSAIEKALELTPSSRENQEVKGLASRAQHQPDHVMAELVATATEPSGADSDPGTSAVWGAKNVSGVRRSNTVTTHSQSNVLNVAPATLMAGGAAVSFVLAATYFLGLLINSGWLTPLMQLLIATAVGVGLILGGLGLARYDRRYASYMPAVGIIILYLTVYAGQLYHELLTPALSTLFISIITVGAIALGRKFRRDAYAMCAVVGVYVSPLLLHVGGTSSTVIFFYAIWCIVFCVLAFQSGNRTVYLLSVYLAMFSFDASYRFHGGTNWMGHAAFQLFQFLAFAATAALISVRYRVSMSKSEAIAHAPPLFYFYLLEFALFKAHAPELFPWVALASVAAVVAGYLVARRFLDSPAEYGATLVSSYASIVVAHVVFFELLPVEWLPWGALAVAIIALAAFRRVGLSRIELLPVWIVAGLICMVGCGFALLDALAGTQAKTSPWILPVYAIVLYAAFWRLQTLKVSESARTLCLYSGHFALMVASIRVLDNQLLISVVWGLMAVSLLVIALKFRIRILGQSSLFVFAVSAIKVVLYDLSGSAPMIRIGVLLILAVSLYVGGWLYQHLTRATARYHDDDECNEHVRKVLEMAQSGMSNVQIATELTDQGKPCLAGSGWTERIVEEIVDSYGPLADRMLQLRNFPSQLERR